MDRIILEGILEFIERTEEKNSLKNLRKNGYAEGYMACAGEIKDIIRRARTMAEAVCEQKKKGV